MTEQACQKTCLVAKLFLFAGAATKIAKVTSSEISDIKKRLADEEKKRVDLERDMAILKKKLEVMEYSLERKYTREQSA